MYRSIFLSLLSGLFLSFSQPNVLGQSNNTPEFEMTQIGSNNLLKTPWELLVAPDGYLWITERSVGRVVRINPETAERDVLVQISDCHSSAGQDGLLGMTLHKDFENGSPYVYLSYTKLIQNKRTQQIVRYTYSISGNDGKLSEPLKLIENLPSSNDHNSGRLIFGADEKLYYTIGDQGVKVCNENLAQFLPSQQEIDSKNWSDYPGKVLRLNLDGSIPSDNPTMNGVKSHIYSMGHRNPQGLTQSSNEIIYSSEHGPSSDDEINLLNSGKNYGWPYVAGYKDNLVFENDGCHNDETSFSSENYQDPLLSIFPPNYELTQSCNSSWMCRPNIAPSSLEIYESASIPEWENSLLIPSLKRGRIYRLKLDESGKSLIGDTSQHFYTQNRYRDIAVSKDGLSFYIITDGEGKTSDKSGYNLTNSVVNPGSILKFSLINNCGPETTPTLSFDINYHECENDQYQIEYTGEHYTSYSWDFEEATIKNGAEEGPYFLSWDSSGTKYIHFSASNGDCTADTTISLFYQKELDVPQLCLVTVDDISGYNKLVWEIETADVVKYGIYKWTDPQFELIEYINTNQAGSYIDNSALSDQRVEKYKITSVDECGNETTMSADFETIFLSINNTNNAILIDWNQPDEEHFESYSILRSLNGEFYDTIDTVLPDQYTFSDIPSRTGEMAYRIIGKLNDPCNPESAYSSSNIVSTEIITASPEKHELRISPNPATDHITIGMKDVTVIHYKIRSISGKQVAEGKVMNNGDITLSGLKSGIFFIQSNTIHGSEWKKFLKH